ncbi:MAG: acyltransferase family protein [Bacilli bacterium]|jgi:peptidoglycan/LPS O-acetylase OafA/YrhL
MERSLSLIKSQKDQKRNSLIEVLRFLMAISVLVFHGFMPFANLALEWRLLDMGQTCVSVDFFLLLSGYLFFTSLKETENLTLGKGLLKLLGKRIKRLGLPFLVALGFATYNVIYFEHIGWYFGYLWFIPVIIGAEVILYLLVRLIKNKWVFIAILLVCGIAGYAYFYSFPPSYHLYPQGGYNIYFDGLWSPFGYPLRGIAGVFLGCLLNFVPKINNQIIRKASALFAFAAVIFVSFTIFFPFKEQLLLVLFAFSIYALFQIEFSFPIFNFLGAISFGLYIFQTLGSTLRSAEGVGPVVTLIVIIAMSIVSQPKAFYEIFAKPKMKIEKSI